MKKVFLWLLTPLVILVVIIGCISALSLEGSAVAEENDLRYVVSNGNATIVGCDTAADGHFVIPSTLDGYPVTAIGEAAFKNCVNLTGVSIPDTVTSIGYEAFWNCTGLESIRIGAGVKIIDQYAFGGCSSVRSIEVATGNKVYHSAGNCLIVTSRKELVLGCMTSQIPGDGSVTRISRTAFNGCVGLTSITIPEPINYIGGTTFYGCDNLAQINYNAITMQANDRISDLFSCAGKNVGITVNIGPNVAQIPAYHFSASGGIYGDSHIKTVNFAQGSLTSIGAHAFDGCTELTDITTPDSVTFIGEGAFLDCSGLKSAVISSGKLGDSVFENCTGLSSVTLGKAVTSLGRRVFYGCSDLTQLEVDSENSVFIGKGNCIIHKSMKEVVAGCKSSVIPVDGSAAGIGNAAFAGCAGLTELVVPDCITIIDVSAFADCYALSNVNFGNGIKTIENNAFQGCTGLVNLSIPDSVQTIKSAFADCSNLKSITVGSGASDIAANAFNGCVELASIQVDKNNKTYHSVNNCLVHTAGKELVIGCKNSMIPSDGTVTAIGRFAFAGCTNLKTVVIPETIKTIGANAFQDCTGLTEIIIPDSVESVYLYAFAGCDNLQSISLGNGVRKIGQSAFAVNNLAFNYYGNGRYLGNSTNPYYALLGPASSNITNLEIHGDTRIIADNAFADDANLTAITIPDHVTHIGTMAFQMCWSVTHVTLGDSVVSIGEQAFQYCYKLTDVTMGENVSSIGRYAFSNCNKLNFNSYGGGKYLGNAQNPYYALIAPESNEVVTLDIHVKTGIVADEAIRNLDSLTEVTGSDGLKYIGILAFYDCDNLTDFAMGNNLVSIGDSALDSCSALPEIYLPDTLQTIGESAFENCYALKNIYFQGSAPNAAGAIFRNVTATAEYTPDASWTEDVMAGYGGKIKWVARKPLTQPGDVNGDGEVDNKDVAHLLWHTLFPDSYPVQTDVDFSKDGKVDNKDVEHLLWHTLFPDTHPI